MLGSQVLDLLGFNLQPGGGETVKVRNPDPESEDLRPKTEASAESCPRLPASLTLIV